MVKLTIEQGYSSIELECNTLQEATEVIELIKDKSIRKTKYVVENKDVKGEEEHDN
jgi:hypothetical protein